ncbi:MBL fold metallo-hydrolase [Archangium sp.]|uniref:MBL fold metallo-hydrolase n=1 Tax=Archangium sp. TaxID=1872627 RepID=UPI00286D210E|nr:MBL fold metallo-hydrolase [Archangium sp.]
MVLPPDMVLDLVTLGEQGVPYDDLLRGLLASGFEPEATRRMLARANERLKTPLLRPQGVEDGGFLVEEPVLFPEAGSWWVIFQQAMERSRSELPEEAVPVVAEFLRLLSRSEDVERVREAWPFDDAEWLERLTRGGTPDSRWPEPDGPGIYRREHACVLIRSRTTSILVDPIQLQRRLPSMRGAPLHPGVEQVDAVAITHSHVDHWHLPSLLGRLSGAEFPVLVPRVPRLNLLTPVDFQAVLRACGQRVLAPGWHETTKVGDIEVEVLPFYGEQPTRDGPRYREGLRSWGNCYRFDTEDFSCLLLVDSGTDPEGGMAEAVAESCRRRGPVDVVLACQREFLSPFFGGLSHYWAALPWARLQALYGDYREGRLKSATAGPSGAAEVCAAARSRSFLAYANGYEGMGQPITDVGWGDGEPSEAQCNARMREHLARLGVRVEVGEWRPGEVARFSAGRLRVERPAAR